MTPLTDAHCAFITDLEGAVPALHNWLTADEIEHTRHYRRSQRRLQYLAGRGLVRWLVQQHWQIDSEAITITRQANGAPLLQVDGHPWQCSISHSQDIAMVAVSPREPIGVDVEQLKPRRQLVRLLRTGFMSGVEASNLISFYQRWTLAEAVTKAEQGLLLNVLKRSSQTYLSHANFRQVENYMLCCYSPLASSTICQARLAGTELILEAN